MHRDYEHKCADCCDDQLPGVSKVGRGIPGNSFYIDCYDDEQDENLTYLIGKEFDSVTKQWNEVWRSDNINGGRLQLFYHLNPQDSPRSFTLTFVYSRPSKYDDGTEMSHKRTVWGFVTPAIPYLYTNDPMMGSVVGTLFLKDHQAETDDKYKDMLTYPAVANSVRDPFNAPLPPGGKDKITNAEDVRTGDRPEDESTHMPDGTEWNVYLDVTEMDEMASITGLGRNILLKIIKGVTEQIKPSKEGRSDDFQLDFKTIKSDNIKDYIDDMLERENTLRHQEDEKIHEEIIEKYNELNERIEELELHYGEAQAIIQQIVNKFAGSNTINWTGKTITWSLDGKAAIGNINIYGMPGGTGSKGIRTHEGNDTGDIRAQ